MSEQTAASGEIPESYQPARWVGTLPADGEGRVGLIFTVGLGELVRLKLDPASARHVAETLAEALGLKMADVYEAEEEPSAA